MRLQDLCANGRKIKLREVRPFERVTQKRVPILVLTDRQRLAIAEVWGRVADNRERR